MSLLVVGSMALDTVETPDARVDNVFGGSASYLSYAASFFTPVRLVGCVGKDFPAEYLNTLAEHDIDISGLEKIDGPTFRWHGKYQDDKNLRETVSVELNVLGDFEPDVPESFRSTPYVFLANADPVLQMKVLGQMTDPKLVVADTMDHWINSGRSELIELLGKVGGFVANDEEIRMITGEHNLVRAGMEILEYGPKFLVLKKGEHGVLLFISEGVFPLPAYPLENVTDPTGAGDSFGGGMLGYLASTDDLSIASLKRAVAYGSVTASFTCEDFSLEGLKCATREDIEERYKEYVEALRIGE
jgi:sugar/nucleoside kinase (ribokinase family)